MNGSQNPSDQAEMNANPADIANTTTTTTTATAPAPEPEWECSVCYGDGRRTARIALPCDHPICLGCYSRMRDAQPDYLRIQNRAIPCPLCRTPILGTTDPSPQEIEEFKRLAGHARETRIRLESFRENIRIQEAELERQLQRLRQATTRYEGAYEEYEPWTHHRPELANLHARVEAPVQVQPNAGAGQAPPAPAPAADRMDPNLRNALANPADRCPGCHTIQPEIRLRTMADGRRLRRCRNCLRASRLR